MAGTTISYNGNSLQTSTILTSDIDHHSSPDAVAQIQDIAHTNAGSLAYINWPRKIVTVQGSLISTTTLTALDQAEDLLKSYLTATNANLDIGYAGSTRRYNAMAVTKLAISRPQELWTSKFNTEFTCQSFGMDTSATILVNVTGQTTATYTATPTFGGTAPYQYPIYTLTLTTIGGSPVAGTVQIGNNNNGQTITVTRTWTSGDVLVIDTTQLLNTSGVSTPVTVNGAAVAFSGAFPEFPSGAASIGYNDTFSSRTFSLNIVNTNRYM